MVGTVVDPGVLHKGHSARDKITNQPDWKKCKYEECVKIYSMSKYKMFGVPWNISKEETIIRKEGTYMLNNYGKNKSRYCCYVF